MVSEISLQKKYALFTEDYNFVPPSIKTLKIISMISGKIYSK